MVIVQQPPETIDCDARSLSQTWGKWNEEVKLYVDNSMHKKSGNSKGKAFAVSPRPQGK